MIIKHYTLMKKHYKYEAYIKKSYQENVEWKDDYLVINSIIQWLQIIKYSKDIKEERNT